MNHDRVASVWAVPGGAGKAIISALAADGIHVAAGYSSNKDAANGRQTGR